MPASMRRMVAGSTLPTQSASAALPIVTIWETLATESRSRPDASAGSSTLPGASARRTLEVTVTASTVSIRLRLNRSLDTTTTGRRWRVADPFHVVLLGNDALDDVRRRVQNQTLGHRGRKDDPLYRARKLLVSASENITAHGHTKLRGLLDAGDPYGEVRDAWHAKETLRAIYDIADHQLGIETVNQLAADLQDPGQPEEINRLGRTITAWRTQISNWHAARVTNAPTEAAILWSASEGVVDVADRHVAGCRGRVLWSVSLESAMLLAV